MPVLSTISQETDEHGFKKSETFRTERGMELELSPNVTGLWVIKVKGGGPLPRLCDGQFTGYNAARKALIEYIESTDRNGYAEHPDKPADQRRQSVKYDGPSENLEAVSDVRTRTDDGSVTANLS